MLPADLRLHFAGAEVSVSLVCVKKQTARLIIEADVSKLLCRIVVDIAFDEETWQNYFTKMEIQPSDEVGDIGTMLDAYRLKDVSLSQEHLTTVVQKLETYLQSTLGADKSFKAISMDASLLVQECRVSMVPQTDSVQFELWVALNLESSFQIACLNFVEGQLRSTRTSV